MKLPPLKKSTFEDYLPVSYTELRGNSYSNWRKTRKLIMNRIFDPEVEEFSAKFINGTGCLLCDGRQFTDVFVKEDFRFVECSDCRLVQVNPLPKPELVDMFYNTDEYNQFTEDHLTKKADYRKNRFGVERVIAWEQYLGKSTSKKRLRSLDVGCSSGFVLEAAIERGWEAYGIDLNISAVKSGRDRGLQIYDYKLEELSSNTFGKFDVVTMYDVLEHSYNPKDMIKAASRLLVEDGLLVIYVPNWNSLARMVLGSETFWIWGIFHLSYFSIETLSRMVSEQGFQLLHYETQGMDVADIIWSYENEKGLDTTILKNNIDSFQYCCAEAGLGALLRLFVRK